MKHWVLSRGAKSEQTTMVMFLHLKKRKRERNAHLHTSAYQRTWYRTDFKNYDLKGCFRLYDKRC